MSAAGRLAKVVKSVRQIGPLPLVYNGLYRLGLWTGFWRMLTPHRARRYAVEPQPFTSPAFTRLAQSTLRDFFNRQPDAAARLLAEAEELLNGQVRLFGGPPRQIQLYPPGELHHWTVWENGYFPTGVDPDIKLVWEPARFDWAFTLARAYLLTDEERFAAAFWEYFLLFQDANPLNLGPNWMSAQEIALRLMALCFAGRVFAAAPSSIPERMAALQTAVAEHASRLSLTRIYALSQNNNHLLSESAGLLTAGVFLSEHPHAAGWVREGWRWSLYALEHQIRADGSYTQHSNNYHRLMLAAALWVQALGQNQALRFPVELQKKMAVAARWLEEQVDSASGQVPNLGSNDGANIFPLSSTEFSDYRPVVQAASQRFLLKSPFSPGPWDEFSLWLEVFRQRRIEMVSSAEIHERSMPRSRYQVGPNSLTKKQLEELPASPHLILRSENSWASLRAVRYATRPFHADQTHVELWWRGINLACDAGTYRYNAAPPWDNPLSRAGVHNTVTIAGQEPMTRAGKFLWLDWDQAERLPSERNLGDDFIAEHDGYLRLGYRHRRRLYLQKIDVWRVEDLILPTRPSTMPVKICLHWLIREFPWELTHRQLILSTPAGRATLATSIDVEDTRTIVEKEYRQVIRAGRTVLGRPEDLPTLGWFSPTYDVKIPALSYRTCIEAIPPIRLVSEWTLTEQ